jgi:hypothetical protein
MRYYGYYRVRSPQAQQCARRSQPGIWTATRQVNGPSDDDALLAGGMLLPVPIQGEASWEHHCHLVTLPEEGT